MRHIHSRMATYPENGENNAFFLSGGAFGRQAPGHPGALSERLAGPLPNNQQPALVPGTSFAAGRISGPLLVFVFCFVQVV